MNASSALRGLRVLLPIVAAVALTISCGGSDRGTVEGGGDGTPVATATASADETTTETSQASSYAEFLAEMARAYGIEDPPAVDVVRVIDPIEQREVLQRCLAEAGFPADADGVTTMPDEQRDAFFLATYTCHAQYPFDDRVYAPLTDSQRLFIRDYLLETAIPCLADLGYIVPEPPTPQTYLANAGTSKEYILSNQLFDLGLSQKEVQAAMDKCPEGPPYADIWAQ